MIRVTVEKLPEDGSRHTIATAVIRNDQCAGEDAICQTYRFNLTTLPWEQRGGVSHPYHAACGRLAFDRTQPVWKLIADAVGEAERKGDL